MDVNANHFSRNDKGSNPMYLSEIDTELLTRNIQEQPDSSAPCYFQNQKVLAEIIVKRIKLLLEHYQNGRQLEDFTDFDFQIYTSRTNTLKEQTKGRLLNRDSGVIPPGYTDEEALKFADRRVHLYQYHVKERQRREELFKEAESNPNKLFLIIADEAHWGITSPGEEGKVRAHDMLINQWHCDKYKNVIVLLVTATGYNLLTEQSRLPLKVFCAESLSTGELEIVNTRETDDITNKVRPKVSLHQVKWTETYSARLEQGVKMVIRTLVTSSRTKCSKPIYVGPSQGSLSNKICLVPLVGVDESCEDLTILVRGENGRVKIFDSNKRQLKVLKVRQAYHVLFVDSKYITAVCTDEFEMAMTFGEDIFALYPILCGSPAPDKLSLYYDAKYKIVRVHPKPKSVRLGNDVLTDAPVMDLFFVDKLEDIDGRNDFRYISLNYYYNTIWHAERNSRKLRCDDAFEKLCQDTLQENRFGRVHKETDVFIAEYCIFTIVLSEFVNFLASDTAPLKTIQDILEEIWEMTDKIDCKLSKFKAELDLSKYVFDERFIEQTAISDVLEHHKMLVQCKTMDNFTDCWKNILQASLFGCRDQVSKLRAKISKGNKISTKDLIDRLKYVKEGIIDSNETSKIIADVMQVTKKNGILQGSLKVIKVPTGNIASKLYYSLDMAREFASDGSFYNFDIVQDGQNCKLSNLFNGDKQRNKFHVHLLLQKKLCGKNDKGKICPCRQYVPKSKLFSIKCDNCGHPHNPMQKFEDLQGMPAILILVEKGKMGDTFPQNFNCMDLRIKDSKEYVLSTVVQLLGRLCRHNRQDDLRNVPYALLPKSLIDYLKKDTQGSSTAAEEGNALLYSSFMQTGSIDRHTTVDNVNCEDSQGDIRKTLNAASSNFDNKNGSKSKRRKSKESKPEGCDREDISQEEDKKSVELQTNKIILGAEPQCGKTGTYSYLIASLRAIICKEVRMEDVEDESSETDEEDDDDDDDEDAAEAALVTPAKKSPLSDLEMREMKWQYPYHGQMRREKLNNKVARSSKYTPYYGLWSPNKAPGKRRVFRTLEDDNLSVERSSKPSTCRVPYKAECFTHKCSACHDESNLHVCGEFELAGDGYSTKLYVSNVEQSSLVLGRIRSSEIQTKPPMPELPSDPTDLNSWIFIPTAGRAKSACLNLKHTMRGPRSDVDHTEVGKTYVQVLVVPEENFKEYCSVWGSKVTAILQLPESMRDDDEKTVSSVEGGIGFSRRFIHMFALALNLHHIFMMDDNVWFFREAKFKEGKVKHLPDGKVEFQCVPMYKVLSHMERQFQVGTPKPATIFQPYKSESVRGLETYTGPSGKYAILGVRKSRKGSERVKKAFKKAHVYSMILLNVKATAEKDIRYQPWEAFEDLDFNERSNRQDLWVCKYNRFLLSKKIMRTVPTLFFWDEETELIDNGLITFAEDENKRLANWIKHFVMPRVKSAYGGEDESLKDLFDKVQEKNHGKNTFFAVAENLSDSATKQDLKESVEMLVQRTAQNKCNQGYSHYAIAVSVKTCLQCSVTKMADFERLVSEVFKKGFILHVATSHKVTEFKTKVVLLTVQGEDKFVGLPEGRDDHEVERRGEVPMIDVTSSRDEAVNKETEDPNHETSEKEKTSNELIDTGTQPDISGHSSEEGIADSPAGGNQSDHGSCLGLRRVGSDRLDIPHSSPTHRRDSRAGQGDGRARKADWDAIRRALNNGARNRTAQRNEGDSIRRQNLPGDDRKVISNQKDLKPGQSNYKRNSLPSTAAVKRPRASTSPLRQEATHCSPQPTELTARQMSHPDANAQHRRSMGNDHSWADDGPSDDELIEFMKKWEARQMNTFHQLRKSPKKKIELN